MTQLELAQKLQVTDKAVSRWERGVGLPDIHTMEPLAKALGVSVLELMRSERSADPGAASGDASAILHDAADLVRMQHRAERRSILKISAAVAVILLMVFLIDGMGWMGFLLICLPVILLLTAVVLTAHGIWRRTHKLPCGLTFFLAALAATVPVAVAALLFAAGLLGLGPVPN